MTVADCPYDVGAEIHLGKVQGINAYIKQCAAAQIRSYYPSLLMKFSSLLDPIAYISTSLNGAMA